MAQFVDFLYVAIRDLINKVHMIKEGYQFLGITYLFTDDHKKMDKYPMRLVESIKSLCEEIPLEFILLSKKRPNKKN
jgi:hypothetical protein